MMAPLKVLRTATGFHDAYVAAPSRKAALAAWGTAKDLFARGAAEVVTDPALTAEPLAAPGQVFRRVRGYPAEQIAALGEPLPARTAKPVQAAPPRKPRVVKPPKPSREELERAEAAVEQLAARHAEASAALADEARELAERKRALKTSQADEIAAAKLRAASERRNYEAALARWSSD